MPDEAPPAQREAVNEDEREPVPEKAWKGPTSFWGMYAGEHTAGTEFMLGPLFIAWGANPLDMLLGLLCRPKSARSPTPRPKASPTPPPMRAPFV